MKKIITLVGAVLLVASSFAQYDSRDKRDRDNDVAYNDGRYDKRNDKRDDRYHYNYRERDIQIARINQEYDNKIQSVKHRWFMSHSKKQQLIYQLEDRRRYEIRKVYTKFNNRNDRFDDHDRDHGSRRNW